MHLYQRKSPENFQGSYAQAEGIERQVESAMSTENKEPRSYRNAQGKLVLPQVTLCAMTSVNVRETLKAMEYSCRGIEFADAVIITDKKPRFLPKGIRYSHIDRLGNIDAFNYKTVYDMGDYIHTDFALLVHYDGFVVHPEMWRDDSWTMTTSVRPGRCQSRAMTLPTGIFTAISAAWATAWEYAARG